MITGSTEPEREGEDQPRRKKSIKREVGKKKKIQIRTNEEKDRNKT
jgi:hypothetical protein